MCYSPPRKRHAAGNSEVVVITDSPEPVQGYAPTQGRRVANTHDYGLARNRCDVYGYARNRCDDTSERVPCM